MRRPHFLLIAVAALAACGRLHEPAPTGSPLQPPTRAAAVDEGLADLSAYRLGIGDRVRVDVFGEPDLSKELTVDGTGHISYPLLGLVHAQRKTSAELETSIRNGLASGYLVKPDVRVIVVQYRPFYVAGQVKKAGAYAYTIGLTVEKALAIAGGLTNLASTRQMYVVREDAPSQKRVRVNLGSPVLPGDTLFVGEGLF
jgi:polysaccharide biosynthesis/export protein VpsN